MILPKHIAPIVKNTESLVKIDLTADNPELDSTNPEKYLSAVTLDFKRTGYGGYLEKRQLYEVSDLFDSGTYRNIHLGVDIWQSVGSDVFAPIVGKVHSFANNDSPGDYGGTIILEHHLNEQTFFTLYGHLSLSALYGLQEGQTIEAGSKIAEIGNFEENGNWPPHVHFQLITNMLDKKGDFPGVCLENETDKWMTLCPDPSPLISFIQDLH